MALVTYDYKFLYFDAGCQGRISDGDVWANSSFNKKFKSDEVRFPSPQPFPKPSNPYWIPYWKEDPIPFVIAGDNAFPLTENMMTPWPEKGLDDLKRISNYRFSRFRRVSEN